MKIDDQSRRLAKSGWNDRAAATVLDLELEIWVWSNSPRVSATLGWAGRQPDLRAWLAAGGFAEDRHSKPSRPKEALEEASRLVHRPRPSSLYQELSETATWITVLTGHSRSSGQF